MDIERGCLEVLFSRIPYSDLFYNNKISRKNFCDYLYDVFPQYSNDEREYIYDYYEEHIQNDNSEMFAFVADVANRFLTYNGLELQCKYEEILRWRQISFMLGQDLFTTAYLAKHYRDFNHKNEFFAWSPIIRTDNKRLHNILMQGIAENHFHLKGSTQIFTLSWVCLMNNILGRHKEFQQIKSYLDAQRLLNTDGNYKNSLYSDCMKAAFIRIYLFLYMHDNLTIKQYAQGLLRNIQDLKDFDSMFVGDLQRLINFYKMDASYKTDHGYIDYAFEKSIASMNNNDNRILAGERKFLYDCYCNIFEEKFGEQQKRYFLIYLKIKNVFRNELIQTNKRVGFKNFSDYQNRKGLFIKGFSQYEYEMIRLAINSTLNEQNIVSLETRISPKMNYKGNAKLISKIDKQSAEKLDADFNPYCEQEFMVKHNHYYVFHFQKSPDNEEYCETVARSNKLRRNAKKYARAIISLLESEGDWRYRVKGIDACSHEIGCRPEVFAQVFRYLTNLKIKGKMSPFRAKAPINLYATYHVGEDFLDISDGLRAIDEAILFCNLSRGSRLGHALALGINAKSYYELKENKLILCKQDAMDNIAWLIGKARSYGISIDNVLLSKLEHIYFTLYNELYSEFKGGNISIHDYYDAWKLRGDNPYLYKFDDEAFEVYLHYTPLLQYKRFEINTLVSNNVRLTGKLKDLYYFYHFDRRVREKGKEKYIFQADNMYVTLVHKLQKRMQFDIAKKGIAIEANPSSNYLISTIGRYDEHPIIQFNNLELTEDVDEIKNSPLLSVSINTDDQGVFDTSLENEYALLALALEKHLDDDGAYKYRPGMVYNWLEYIRKLGLEQVF
ncbi:MAG: hypothetical protein FH756_20720 [Firmicutes bacterium]|nr:hypothetical protein [Bacillota bacterium]